MGEPLSKKIRYATARALRKVANRIHPKSPYGPSIVFPNLGANTLPKNSARALVIYNTAGIEKWLRGVPLSHPFFNRHTMYWESTEIVRQLNNHGYIVDYADWRTPFIGDWRPYTLVFDQWDNLRSAPVVSNQLKIHYATYIHWLSWNRAELERIAWFKDRTGILVPANRQIPSIRSDEFADYLTYFGTQYQTDSFSSSPIKHQLDISAVVTPEFHKKNLSSARKNFIWLGGGGVVHKGLDIAIEAFTHMPDLHLHVVGNMRDEPEFWKWAAPLLAKHNNIHELGWLDVAAPKFNALAENCVGIVYPSAAEGGPGSVAQALHWGLIPIVTKSALVRAEIFGYVATGTTAEALINSTVDCVRTVSMLPDAELATRCASIASFAQQHHTRTGYSTSLAALLDIVPYN